MIKVDKVGYGIAPIGADIGMPCFAIHLGNDDTGGLGIDKLDPEKDTDKIRDTFYNKAVDLFNTIEESIKALGKEDTWLECLTQPKYKEYIYLIGKVITDDEYFYVVNMLLQVISAKSRDIQNMIHESGKPIELCAPKFAMIAYPNSPYLQKNIWEACNFIMSWLPKELDGERLDFMNKNKFYHINSITNISKHPFGSFIYTIDTEDDIKLFESFYQKAFLFPSRGAIRIVAGNKEIEPKAVKFALENGYRVAEFLTCDNLVDFNL